MTAVVVAGASAAMCGCFGYHAWPPEPGVARVGDPNATPMDEVMVQALSWTIERYPPGPDQPVAINLPEGVKPEVYRWIAGRVGPNVAPLSAQTMDRPVFHVARIRVRGTEADIDIVRPVIGAGQGASGEPVYQGLTLTLRGGLRPWRVVHRREWEVGVIGVPPLHLLEQETRTATVPESADR